MIRNIGTGVFCPAWVVGFFFLWSGSPQATDDPDQSRSDLSTSEVRRLPATDLAVIRFQPADNIRGEIRIRTDVDIGDVEIEIKKNLYNISSGERAAEILESIEVETEVAGNVLRIGIKTPDDAKWEGSQIGVAVNLEILLPPGRIFRSDSEYFDFDVAGPFREVRIYGTYGRILVEEVTESANLRTEYGTLTLTGAQGRIDVSNRYGSITLKHISGLTTPLKVRSEREQVELETIEGPVDIRVDDAPVTISGWTIRQGSSYIATGNAPVTIDVAVWEKPQVTVHAQNAKVSISTPAEFSALVRLSTSEKGGGYIRTRGLPLKVTQLETTSVEGLAGKGDGMLEVSVEEHGDIMLRGPHPQVRKDADDSI